MKANASPPAVFTSTPAAADHGAQQTRTHVCEEQNARGATSVRKKTTFHKKNGGNQQEPTGLLVLFKGGNYK